MSEFLEAFYMLKPVSALTWWIYLILIGIVVAIWVLCLVVAYRNNKDDWFKIGSKELSITLWQVWILDRWSTKWMDLCFSGIWLMLIFKIGIVVAYLPTVSSVIMLVLMWFFWILIFANVYRMIVNKLKRRKLRKILLKTYRS